jgi:hypothetical protein
MATSADPAPSPAADGTISEIAGPREESMVEMARLLVARRGDPMRIEAAGDTGDPDRDLAATDLVLVRDRVFI